MLRHLVSLLLVCVMIAGVLRPAMAVGHAGSSQGAERVMYHDATQTHGMGGCEGTGNASKATTHCDPDHAGVDAMVKGCATLSGGCFPSAVEGISPTVLGALSQAPWTPWVSPARHLTAIPSDPDFRPPRVLS
jgi:hypothetical protein